MDDKVNLEVDAQDIVDALSEAVKESSFLLVVKDSQIASLMKERDALASENDHLLKKIRDLTPLVKVPDTAVDASYVKPDLQRTQLPPEYFPAGKGPEDLPF